MTDHSGPTRAASLGPVRMVDDPGVASAIREHLRCAIDHPPVGGPAPEGGLAALERAMDRGSVSWTTKLGGGLVVVGGAALAIWMGARTSEPPRIVTTGIAPVVVAAPAPVEIVAPTPERSVDASVVSAAPATAVEPPRRRAAVREREVTVAEPDTQREFRLLAEARKAAASSPARAWTLVQQSEREFPEGMMIEEREALAVEVLVALDRVEDARRRGDRFLAAHPKSPSANRVRELLERASTTP